MSKRTSLTCEKCGHDVFVVQEQRCERGKWALEIQQDTDVDTWTVLVQLERTDAEPIPRLPRYDRWCERCNMFYLDRADDWRPIRAMNNEEFADFLSWFEEEGRGEE